MKVSIVPNSDTLLNNKLFDRDYPKTSQWKGNIHWMDSNIAWQKDALNRGITLKTYDLLPPHEADVILFIDLPNTLSKVLSIKESAPNAKLILLCLESPLSPQLQDKRNHTNFDLVLTYNPKLVDNKKYFHFNLPCSNVPNRPTILNWEERKPCLLINSNYYRGFKAGKHPLHFIVTEYKNKNNGWKISIPKLINNELNMLYNQRRKFAKIANQNFPGFLDIYGKGWHGQKHSWYYRFFPDKPFSEHPSIFEGEKMDLLLQYRFVLAFENFTGEIGYISEKIFDAMLGGTIPIYLGDKNISKHIPDECYIDASKFNSYQKLINYVSNMGQNEWNIRMEAISNYLKSDAISPFLPQTFANTINTTILATQEKQ